MKAKPGTHRVRFQRVLVLAPHTDDGELGCGGTIARFVEEGRDVHCLALSRADVELGSHFPADQLERELRAAMKALGVSQDNITLHDFQTRNFSAQRQGILQVLWEANQRLDPDLVIMPNMRDLHQDHGVVAAEGLRAFKKTSVLCYEQPWNTVSLDTEGFVKLEERHIAAKIAALTCYETQKFRTFLNEDFIRGWARTRGVQVGVEYAECFEVPRLIL